MPAFGASHGASFFVSPPTPTNEQIAAVVNFVRAHFGNHYTDGITAGQVDGLRHSR